MGHGLVLINELQRYLPRIAIGDFEAIQRFITFQRILLVDLLGLALQAASDLRAVEAAATLESQAVSDDREASWPVHQDAMLDFSGDVTPEATAHAVKLLTGLRPTSPLLPRAALWLVNHRDQGYYWSSTKQTAMVVYGLTGYLKASGELHPR